MANFEAVKSSIVGRDINLGAYLPAAQISWIYTCGHFRLFVCLGVCNCTLNLWFEKTIRDKWRGPNNMDLRNCNTRPDISHI